MNKFKGDPRLLGKKVLVVNECSKFRFFISTAFTYVGANVVEAGCGHEMSQRIWEENPDIILIDKEMPDMDSHLLMNNKETEHASVVITTFQKDACKLKSREPLIAENLLIRPFSPEELLRKVTDVIDKKSKHEHNC